MAASNSIIMEQFGERKKTSGLQLQKPSVFFPINPVQYKLEQSKSNLNSDLIYQMQITEPLTKPDKSLVDKDGITTPCGSLHPDFKVTNLRDSSVVSKKSSSGPSVRETVNKIMEPEESMKDEGLIDDVVDPSMGARNWVFTLNNWTQDEADSIRKAYDSGDLAFVCWGEEFAPTTRTPHLQGYLQCKNAKKRGTSPKSGTKQKGTGLMKIPGLRRAWLRPAVGSPEQCINYSKGGFCNAKGVFKEKNENYFQYGKFSPGRQGARNDLVDIKDYLLKGYTVKDLIDECVITSYQQIRMAERMEMYYSKPREDKPIVYWFYGPTETFKSRTAREMGLQQGYEVHLQPVGTKWWSGYRGQEWVILDDVRDTYCSFMYMLNLLDRYNCPVEVKYGTFQLNAKVIVITSAYRPEMLWQDSAEDKSQLLRRITEIVEFKRTESNPVSAATEKVYDFETKTMVDKTSEEKIKDTYAIRDYFSEKAAMEERIIGVHQPGAKL